MFCLFQYAEETIGTAERTELDNEYEKLAERADCYRQWTERIVSKLEAVIQPNPSLFLLVLLFFSRINSFRNYYKPK